MNDKQTAVEWLRYLQASFRETETTHQHARDLLELVDECREVSLHMTTSSIEQMRNALAKVEGKA